MVPVRTESICATRYDMGVKLGVTLALPITLTPMSVGTQGAHATTATTTRCFILVGCDRQEALGTVQKRRNTCGHALANSG
jgi:hypothetical protein